MKKLLFWALFSAVVLLGFGCKPTEPEVPTEPRQPELTKEYALECLMAYFPYTADGVYTYINDVNGKEWTIRPYTAATSTHTFPEIISESYVEGVPQWENMINAEFNADGISNVYRTSQMADIGTTSKGTFDFHFESIDLDELCKEQLDEIKDLLLQDVKPIYQPETSGMRINSDKKRIGQVLHNLLSNACKNTPHGTITLSVSHHIPSDTIRFTVTDTGTGVPPDKVDLIFQHFEKLDHYSPGLGLGLYVSRLIARALGGDISLDTTYTTGARFVFTVPYNNQPEVEKHEEEQKEEAGLISHFQFS